MAAKPNLMGSDARFRVACGLVAVFFSLVGAAPVAAQDSNNPYGELRDAAEFFFEKLRSEDKTALRALLHPEGVIFIHRRMGDDGPAVQTLTNAQYLEAHEQRAVRINELMRYETIRVDGDMGQIWGPYRFIVAGQTSHCGINSISFARNEGRWRVTNISFTMEPPEQCDGLRAPKEPEE
ncbi:MAG: nuclear transport factor 2 family protein [Pseudomonadota bacterium]